MSMKRNISRDLRENTTDKETLTKKCIRSRNLRDGEAHPDRSWQEPCGYKQMMVEMNSYGQS